VVLIGKPMVTVSLAQAKAKPKLENQIHTSLTEAPEIKFQYTRLQREAFVQNKLFTLLAQQLEQAKIDEARDETAFQVLDRAIPPERKSKPAVERLSGRRVDPLAADLLDRLRQAS